MIRHLLRAAALVCLLAGCAGSSAPNKGSEPSEDRRSEAAPRPNADEKTRDEERRRRIKEHEQREQAARKRADDFLYRLGLTGMAKAGAVRSRFLALTPDDQAKALRTAGALQVHGRSALLKEDPPRKEAVFLRAHPELFPEP
jgi:hypothetical protein